MKRGFVKKRLCLYILFFVLLVISIFLASPVTVLHNLASNWIGTFVNTTLSGSNVTLWVNSSGGYNLSGTYTSQIIQAGSSVKWNNLSWGGILPVFNPNNLWNSTINGFKNSSDSGYGIALDSSGNIYIAGSSFWSSGLLSDIYLGKFNSSGSNLWNSTINGPGDSSGVGLGDSAKGVAVDSSGNIYIVGVSYWSSDSTTDIYLGKFNSSGTNLWNATINGLQSKSDSGYGVAVDSSGNVYITGDLYWSSDSTTDIYLGKFNSSGTNLWNTTLDGFSNSNDGGKGIVLDSSGNIYVAGFSYWSSGANADIYVGKFNSSGSNLWNATFDGSGNSLDAGYAIALDSSGNVYIAGVTVLAPPVSFDIYLGKFNSSTGTNLWNTSITGPQGNEDFGYGVAVAPSGDIYITGYTYWNSAAQPDIYLGKFNSSGSNLWNATLDGMQADDDVGYAITSDSSGNVYVTGDSFWSYLTHVDIYLGKFYDSVPIKFQLRSCNDTLCDGETFIGIDNTSSSYFYNSYASLNENLTPNNTYFQYKAFFEGNTSKTPHLSTVSIDYTCVESWTCTEWGACSSNTQTRTCTDSNSCGTTTNKPEDSQSCDSGGGGSITTSVKAKQKETWISITPDKPAVMPIQEAGVDITEIIISTRETATEASLTFTPENIPEEPNFKEGLPEGESYQMFSIKTVNLNSTNIENVTFSFKVNKTWLEKNNGSLEDVRLYRKPNNSSKWNSLPTEYINQDSKYYYYSAISFGFSEFLIFVDKSKSTPSEEESEESFEFPNIDSSLLSYAMILIVIGIFIAVCILFKKTKRGRKNKNENKKSAEKRKISFNKKGASSN